MSESSPPPGAAASGPLVPADSIRTAVEIAIRLGVIFLIVAWCVRIVWPFLGIVIWALIIAIALETPFEKVVRWSGGRRGLAATAVIGFTIVVLAIPTVMLSETLVSGARNFAKSLSEGTLHVAPPPANVARWPIVGDDLYELWDLASRNVQEAAHRVRPQLEAISRWLLGAAGSAGAGILQLLASLVIAGVMLARSEGRRQAFARFAARLAGEERGAEFNHLANATVKSVVQGIVGVALIQSLLAGAGFMVAGIPAAGLWALLVLIAAVVQLPVLLVMIPPIVLGFSALDTAAASGFTVWCVLVALVDNVLKPMLFGRGVEIPMLVIFLGAIGGMLSSGIIGLFVGAVVLAVGYSLFHSWLEESVALRDPQRSEAG